MSIRGVVHGGQQGVAGAHIFLFAANTTGNAGPGLAAVNCGLPAANCNASISLLKNVAGVTAADGNSSNATYGDYYVTSASDGSFSITGDYTSCTSGQQVYLYAVGGNPGLPPPTNNTAAGFLAVLGACPAGGNFAAMVPSLYVDEVTTVAAAYAFAGYASDAVHVSNSGSTLAQTGIANAFANAANLANVATGTALTTTPAGNGTVPQSTINTIADILASCVNSNGAVTGPTNPTACYTLFNNIMSAGATGPQATDTATAAIYLAQNPYPGSTQMANLFGSPAPASPFTPSLSSQPNDFTVGLIFSGGGIARPLSIAIDGSGNVWTGNYTLGVGPTPGTSSLSELAGGTGTPISGASGYTGGGLNQPNYIAIDTAGNAWVADEAGSSLSRFDGSTGTTITGGGVNNAFSVAIDGSGNVWDDNYGDNSLSKFNSAGTAAASTAYTGGGLN